MDDFVDVTVCCYPTGTTYEEVSVRRRLTFDPRTRDLGKYSFSEGERDEKGKRGGARLSPGLWAACKVSFSHGPFPFMMSEGGDTCACAVLMWA